MMYCEDLPKKCNSCGKINLNFETTCTWCKSSNLTEIERKNTATREEWELASEYIKKLTYLIGQIFEEKKPKESDMFGAIEICDAIKEKYNMDDSVYELVGVVDFCKNTALTKIPEKITPATRNQIEKIVYRYEEYMDALYCHVTLKKIGKLAFGNSNAPRVNLEDGRYLSYSTYYYIPSVKEDETTVYDNLPYTQEHVDAINHNTKEELEKMISLIVKIKPATFGEFGSSDISFSLEDMKKARKEYHKVHKAEIQRKEQNELRSRAVEELTKPLAKPYDPNHVHGAKCPNCGRDTVSRISDVKRAGSIWMFGLFSKNIGKTMECKYCGYKW